ncbi:MAG: peptidoglycan bridge formation glycyltransferase FemA/FemB family protein [Chloroflexi bacterium]|nr:peptidoglycan bridge formation glycyltransferase FemA/FemB family protein [Chloroflexota bacterium]
MEVRPANPREIEVWDDLVVTPGGGHVYQSMAWARHRSAAGWRPHHLVAADGSAALALERRWPLLGGGSAYIPRGPIPAGDAGAMARRLASFGGWLADHGIDVVAADAEIEAASGYPALIRAEGFHPIEEIQPSRHKLALPLGHGADEAGVLAGVAKTTRQRIRAAERAGTIVVRHDRSRGAEGGPGEGFAAPTEDAGVALDRFYDLLLETGERRRFAFGPRAGFVAWWGAALAAGWLVLLEARTETGEPLAGLVLYRHGGRLSTVHSGDHAATRREHPGALHLLRWRAIQLAVREGCAEMDLGGVDVPGARRPPLDGEPMFGLYEHKRSFGATWVELAGAHERVIRPRRYALGRAIARLARVARPPAGRPSGAE